MTYYGVFYIALIDVGIMKRVLIRECDYIGGDYRESDCILKY